MDAFDYYYDGEGCYIITRNGDFFLSCCGTESETKNIVGLLKADSERNMEIRHVECDAAQMGREK